MIISDNDSGIVIIDTNTMLYYCGLNKFSKQLRDAKIYHSKKWAREVLTSAKFRGRKLQMIGVEMRTVGVTYE